MTKLLIHALFSLLPIATTFSVQAEIPLEVQKVTDNVYAIVGELAQRSPDNYANNATFGLVVTDEGALLVDPGGSYQGAAQLAAAIRTVTDKPVKVVINSGGQDHRWLGNGYFKERGARIIASAAAAEDHRARTREHFNRLDQLLGKALEGTEEVYPDETFEQKMTLEFGGQRFELVHAGSAHTLGDIFIWMPDTGVMFTGDIVYTERALGIGPAQNTASWLRVFEQMAAYEPKYIIPGHGHLSTLSQARANTYDYLSFLREKVGQVLEEGGDIQDATAIDQSRFSYLEVFDQIAGRNAQAVFVQMEFE